jgi:putative nucleotidyltransferase with HDIG domain
VVNQRFATNPALVPWRDEALRRGYQSSAALPLVDGEKVIGALTLYAAEPEAFSEEEMKLLGQLAEDLAFGILMLRTRHAADQSAQRVERGMESTVQAIAATLEKRDPYTAGHERRVAALATAIAEEMQLPEHEVRGIHLAAVVHDIGKIQVPAELLAKPTKLTPLEYKLIQQHAQAGYDILKDIDFPWPIAEIVLQHHERIDGSGYPQGLKGESIVPGARILAVADTVEAMASHRPYRPGFGIERALAEIEAHRGTLHDAVACDACLRLFREKGFRLPD